MLNLTTRTLTLIYRNLPSLVLSPLVFSALIFASLAHAEIYRWTDDAGNTIYSDQKSSQQAKPAPPSANINSYTPRPATNKEQAQQPATLSVLSAETETQASEADNKLSEAQCQQHYQRSCDKVNNWKRYAREACGNDSRCKDEDFLERKYRPRSNEELLAIAHKAAVRNNMADKKIAQFLTKKYSNYCSNQAAMVCQKKRGNQCKKQVLSYCEDPRGLQDIFQRYDNLSALEKKQIIDRAKAMAVANGDNSLNYDQILSSLIEILISQALMGI